MKGIPAALQGLHDASLVADIRDEFMQGGG